MKELLNNDFAIFYLNDSKKELKIKWLPSSSKMLWGEVRGTFLQTLMFLERHQLRDLELDFEDFDYSIPPEQQNWIDKYFCKPLIELKIELLKIHKSKDFFTQASIEQTFNEENAQKNHIIFFD